MPVQVPPLIGAKPCQQLPPTAPTSRCREERVERLIDLLPGRVQTTTRCVAASSRWVRVVAGLTWRTRRRDLGITGGSPHPQVNGDFR